MVRCVFIRLGLGHGREGITTATCYLVPRFLVLRLHNSETVGSEVTRVLDGELVETEMHRGVRRIAIQMLYSIEVPFELRKCHDFLLCGVEVDPVSHPYTSEELYNIGSGLEVGGGRGGLARGRG